MLVDTHCHIHESSYPLSADEVISRAHAAGVSRMICVGTSNQSSREAVDFCRDREGTFAAIGVHPHESKDGIEGVSALLNDTPHDKTMHGKLVAVGEIGLDYYYSHSPRELQIKAVEAQIDLALRHNLPIIFHVREAFDDFWSIFDNFHGIRGELHSFTDSRTQLEEGLKRGLLIGVNGISTFTKDEAQQATFDAIPIEKMLLETDAPFLTPKPFRGTINEPAYVRNVAQFHADRRGISLEEIAHSTTQNARLLFAID